MGFMPEGWHSGAPSSSLTQAVARLSVLAKQAMYAAAKKGLIERGTWDGCAFNKAGEETGKYVHSSSAAAAAFDMPVQDVQVFIKCWDQTSQYMNPQEARQSLIEAIEASGICTPPSTNRRTRVVRGFAFKSAATKFAEELESGDLTVDMIPGCEAIGELLSSCSA